MNTYREYVEMTQENGVYCCEGNFVRKPSININHVMQMKLFCKDKLQFILNMEYSRPHPLRKSGNLILTVVVKTFWIIGGGDLSLMPFL